MSARKWQRELDARGGAYATGTCPTGKRCHQNRRSAKAHASRLMQARLREYRCDQCGFWHVGHLPRSVRRGELTAREFYTRARPFPPSRSPG